MKDLSKTSCWRDILQQRAEVPAMTEAEEQELVRVMGQEYVDRVKQLDLLHVTESDLGAIREMRPDLPDADVAHLVRTADDDDDVEAWIHRVLRFRAGSIV